jgi:hypothetical protein
VEPDATVRFDEYCLQSGGARISVTSRKTQGSTFAIEFPPPCEIRRRRSA